MRRIIYTAVIILFSVGAQAQYNLGIATGNWNASSALYLNPANIADCHERFTVSILSVNAGVDNNLGSLNNSGGGIINSINTGKTNNIFSYSNSSTFSLLAPYVTITGPGLLFSINDKNSLALTSGISGMNQFNNFDRSLYQTITDPNFTSNSNVDISSSRFNYTAHLWSQVGLTYGAVLLEQGHHELKAGVTLRYLGGIGYIGLKGNNLDVRYTAGSDSFLAVNKTDVEYASNVLSTNSVINNGISNNSILSQFFGAKAGSGMGGDLGLVYDYIPNPNTDKYNMDGKTGIADHSANRYLFRFSASVLDLGSITYKSANNSNAEVTGNGYLTGTGLLNNVNSYNSFRNYVVAQGFTADTAHANTKVYMPTRLVLSADYNIYNHYYVNATMVNNLANRQNFGNSYYNQVTVTPRYDTRLLSVGLPITYNMLSSSMKVGLGVRFSGFFIGSDDMLALVTPHQYGFNLYAGGNVPFYKYRPKDTDGDGVSDRMDKCPHEFGSFENHGCPDRSNDNDTTDNCPDMMPDGAGVIDQKTKQGIRKGEVEVISAQAATERRQFDLLFKQEYLWTGK